MRKLFCFIFFCLSLSAFAQSIVVSDTLLLSVTSIVPEPNPNANEYIFSFYGTDNTGKSQKVQIRYSSESMYGTFTNNDFYNWDGSLGSGSYNYIRRADSDLGFYPFKNELTAVVANVEGATEIDVNGLIQVWGQWTRVLLHGVIPAPAPDDTISLDLGLATVIPMNQLGYEYLRLDAANDTYSLAFGIVGMSALQAGTYYQAELLRPDLVYLPDDSLTMTSATLVVTDNQAGFHNLALTLLSEDNVLYEISMHTGLVEAVDTVQVVCSSGLMQNLKEMYGIYQVAGVSADYQVAIALTPGVIEQSQLSFTSDSVNLAYTRLLDVAAGELIYVQHACGRFEPDSSAFLPCMMVYADLLGINGTLYQVAIPVGGSQLPTAVDTTIIECGDRVGRLDFTNGAGWLGLVLGNEDADVHATVYTGLSLKGSFTSDMFIYDDPISYVTIYNDPTVDARFSNVQAAEMRMDSIGDTLRIELNVVTETSHMFCFRARLLPTRALTGEEVDYVISNPLADDGMMVAFRLDKVENESLFQIQFQRSDNWDEETGELLGDNYEVWNFVFVQDSIDGISGNYGYSAATLSDEPYHMITEHGTEIWLQPMAGTLKIDPIQPFVIPAEAFGFEYHTHIYSVEAHVFAESGIIYNITGANYLLCMDAETEQFLEFTETELTALNDVLAPEGLRVKKVLRDGMILLESTVGTYTIQGQRLN